MRRLLLALLLGLPALAVATPAAAGPPLPAVHPFAFHPATAGATSYGTHVLWANGSATTTLTAPEGARRLRIEARVDPCEGPARFEVRVDGTLVATQEVAGRGTYAVPGSWAAGPHHVSIRYTNDLVTGRCDRNLKLGDVRFVAAEPISVSQHLLTSTMTVGPVTAGRVQANSTWGYDPGPLLWANGTARGVVDTSGADVLEVHVKRWPCRQAGAFAVRVDGETVYEGAPGGWSYYEDTAVVTVDQRFPDGLHQVEVEFLNDYRDPLDPTCDRNIQVAAVMFFGRV